jgi:hypothetical protein
MQELALPGKSTKGVIIDVLSKGHSLSAKQIYNQFKKRAISITYHSVYDMIQEMVVKSIVVKTEKNYQLSNKWLSETCITMERIKIRHTIGPITNFVGNEEIKTMTFPSYREYVKFLRGFMDYFLEHIDPNKKNAIHWMTYHATRGILNAESITHLAKKMKEKNVEFYASICGNTTLDKLVKTMYENAGFNNMKLGIPNTFGMYVTVYNDVAICAFIPSDKRKEIEDIYKKSNKIGSNIFMIPKCLAEIANCLNSITTEVKIMIIKSPDLVESYKKHISSLFNKSDSD